MTDEQPPARRLKTKIEIPLYSVRKYVGGSGPPLAKTSLAPPHDSTGYIIDQFILPTPANMTEHSRRLIHYHVGFTDLPAAKILVPCDKILDYVSPREYEDWEYKNFDQRMQERAQEEARKKAEQASGAVKKKPVGRPPKVEKPHTTPSPSQSPKGDALVMTTLAGPSLSTPQKRNLGHSLDDEDSGETTSNMDSDDAAIQMQLQGEAEIEDDTGTGMGADANIGSAEPVNRLPLPFEASEEDTSSRASISVTPPRSVPLPPPAPPRSEPIRPKMTPIPPPQPWKRANIRQGSIHPAYAQSIGLQAGTPTQVPSSTNGYANSASLTPIHPKYQQDVLQSKVSSLASRPASATPSQSTPTATTVRSGVVSNWGSINKRKTPPVKAPSEDALVEPPSKVQKTETNSKSENKKRSKKVSSEEWEVKELLDDVWTYEDGVPVHKYLVNWVGNWPPGQNPTWEPEANIQDGDLIQQYEEQKKPKNRSSKTKSMSMSVPTSTSSKKKKKQNTLDAYLTMKSPYSSVAAAFEGDLALEGREPVVPQVESEPEELQKEEFFVTEEANTAIISDLKTPPRFPRFDDKLARYKQSYLQEPKR
ncbi:hypothetical protein QBC44DRAFT_239391 [Cladorrhinum sp. PSN332]|nr:hypothetical protein QBC44DRAFT_239391 [Cladorrhinum sp. PSN332]